MNNFSAPMVLKNSSEDLSRHLPQLCPFGSNETCTHIIFSCLINNVTLRSHLKDLREPLVIILIDRT